MVSVSLLNAWYSSLGLNARQSLQYLDHFHTEDPNTRLYDRYSDTFNCLITGYSKSPLFMCFKKWSVQYSDCHCSRVQNLKWLKLSTVLNLPFSKIDFANFILSFWLHAETAVGRDKSENIFGVLIVLSNVDNEVFKNFKQC